MAEHKNFELKRSNFTHLSMIQYEKMKGVTIEACQGPKSAGLLFNDVPPEEAIQFLQSMIKEIQVKKYPMTFGDYSIQDADHERRVIDVIDEHIRKCTGGTAPGQRRYLNHLYHLKQRIKKSQKLTKKMNEHLVGFLLEVDRRS